METVLHKAGLSRTAPSDPVDPITTEVVRHALNSAANQMKRALVRTAFSPVIYEVLDFAVALYDRDVRLLAQAPSLPMFMGTLNFCVTEAVKGIGGEENLNEGDIIIYNWPYGTGSHPQDLAVVMPAFHEGELVGYAAIKGHWLDIGGKDPYCTDTVDVFQEGTIYPGVKIVEAGRMVDPIYRIILANSRVPKMIAGDLNAEIVGVRTGVRALLEVVARHGKDEFGRAVEQMFDHGERVVRDYFSRVPNGTYTGGGIMDDNGVEVGEVPFEITVVVEDDSVRLDYSAAPPQQAGPINTPVPSTISTSRVAISMLAGMGEAPNEGHFRAIEVVTRPGTMFHPLPPAPCFLYGWPAVQAIEAVYQALSKASPEIVPAMSGGCICSLVHWGTREATGEPWADGAPHPVGQGAWKGHDGGTMLHIAESATRFSPVEVWESRNPWLLEKMELAADSCGPGEWRGGSGIDFAFRMLEDTYVTTSVERTRNGPWGLLGGIGGRANDAVIHRADGSEEHKPKATRISVPKGDLLSLRTGGGGGYGDPASRDPQAVRDDLADGYITEDHARRHYGHVDLGPD
ncbi:hydantoinase B/oxoprolinase family protein [Allosediminivita pacifica]|uniref:N-methylhydantoinase B n=1 Tax=Allosediminivita pacifica TaxID=1267769 RepID=A0A2T6ACQ2_9RHOB|nr:hydantoinase B/oxoprolinase family protein [Allosediminivita pacifica]PTX41562.1 N-methylhydantoinase B [Allosediminivita pacifica]GGB22982.1 5-oxoprolinase [Allosediminivita pacifica]